MRLINWMVNNFFENNKKSNNNHQNNNSDKFIHSSLFLIAKQQHGVINENNNKIYSTTSNILLKQKHPWEATKRFMRIPLNLISNTGGRSKKLSISSSSSSFSEEVWIKMHTTTNNNNKNNLEKIKNSRLIENRRFTESPKALRRSFRRVVQTRRGSVFYSKNKLVNQKEITICPNNLNNIKLNKINNEYLLNNKKEEQIFDKNKKIEKLEEINKKEEENNFKNEEINNKNNNNLFKKELLNNKYSSSQKKEQINVTDFAFQLQEKMTKIIKYQNGNGQKHRVLFVDSPNICLLRKEKLIKNVNFDNQTEKYKRKWSSERIKIPSKNLLKNSNLQLNSSFGRIKKIKNEEKEDNYLKKNIITPNKYNNNLILNYNKRLPIFERKFFDLKKRHSNASTESYNERINNSFSSFNWKIEFQKYWNLTKKEELLQNNKNEFIGNNRELKRQFWSLRNKKRNDNSDNIDKKLSNSYETVGTRLALLKEESEKDNVWMFKRFERKQNKIEKIVKLTGEWVQVQILHLPNEPEGLGFGIVGGHSTGVVVKSIIAGSVADKDQRLKPGDRILQIGNISTQGLNSQQIAALLRQQDSPYIQMTVAHSIQLQDNEITTDNTPFCWIMATRAALSATTLDDEVQRRLELFENKPSTSKCNGINHNNNKTIILNEGTEFPDQLTHCLGPETVLKDLNKPNTSSANIIGEDEMENKNNNINSKPKRTLLDSERKNINGKIKKFRSSRGHSNENPSCSSSSERRSLKQLQEMALTSFSRDKWLSGKYKIIQVQLNRDSKIGLGITVAGYVYRKEEISGVFIKSLVPQSAAHLSKQIQLHDLIIDVNGKSLEGLSHNDSVRLLINSGQNVCMKLVRFDQETPQAKCLKMLHEQELFAATLAHSESVASSSTATTHVGGISSPLPKELCEHHKKHSLIDYKSFWANRFGLDYDIIVVDLEPDEKIEIDGGIGIEWQGTVDICNGNQLCSHHFIESLRKNGPAEKTGILKTGDELLQVNDISLYGESFVKMRKLLNCERKEKSSFIRLIFCRKSELEFINFVIPTYEQCLPIAYPLLASMMAGEEHFIKAKSEIGLSDFNKNNNKFTLPPHRATRIIRNSFKSRSLENLSGLAVWNCIPLIVPLLKDAKGLGFSIADYQDPLHPAENVVIVIKSLVPGGAAQADGRVVPGDRLLFVNDKDLSNSSLENAVEVLKTAPIGQIVRLGIAKPVPIEKCRLSTSPIFSQSERLQAKSHSPRGRRRRESFNLLNTTEQCFLSTGSSQEEIWIGKNSLYNSQRCLNPQLYFPSPSSASTPKSSAQSPMQTATISAWTPCSSRSLSPCASPAASLRGSWSYDIVFLPSHLERHIKIIKNSLPLGVSLDADTDKAINGCIAKNICSKKALAKDGRIQPGDYIVKINGEILRNVTNAQARAIMKRANLVGAQCNISYITSSDARLWKDRFHRLDNLTMFSTDDHIQQNVTTQNLFENSRLSPKVYPKFYKSPLFNKDLRLLTENALDFNIESSELQSPNNDDIIDYLPTTSINLEKNKKEREILEKFSEDIQKAIIADAIFDLYILWRRGDKKSILHSNIAPSLSSPSSSSLNPLPAKTSIKTSKIYLRASSIANTQPPPKPQKGILRRAASSFKKKRSKNIEEEEQIINEYNNVTTKSKFEMNRFSKQNSLEISETENIPTSSSLPISPKCDELQNSTNRGEAINFWSEPRSVILQRNPNETFGISIVGGRVEVSQKGIEMTTAFGNSSAFSSTVSGIFIKSVIADSPAGRCGKLFMGDRLLRVNDIDLINSTHDNAVQAIKNAENPVCFEVQSLQSLQTFVNREGQNSKKDSLTSIISEGQTSIPPTPFITEIDIGSAAALEKEEDDNELEDIFHYTQKKVLKKYSDLPGKPVLIRMPNIPPGGLGLILSTRRDEGANRPPVIVVGVKSDSPLSLKVGDELLEINGRVLFGLNHQDATEKIRKCCQHSSLSLLVLRQIEQQQISSNQIIEQEKIKTTKEDLINNIFEVPPMTSEKEYTSESECELGAKTIVSEILSKQQKMPQVKIEAPEDINSTTLSSNLRPETTQNDIGIANILNEPISRKRSWQMEQQQSQFLQKCPIQIGQETLIEIDKDGKGLGLSIVGGSDTVLGTVIIHEVYQDGAAAIDGRLKPGDQVFEVNNTSLRNSTHEQAILLLRRTPAKVRLLVYRDQNLQMSLLDPTQIYNIIDIDILKKAGKGLGLSIVGRKNEPGVYVSEIVKGGVADSDGRLMQGDQILVINSHDVANWMQEDVATILKTCTGKVSLKIGRWKLTETAQRVRSAQPPLTNSTFDNSNNCQNINSNEATQMPLQQQQNINEIQSTNLSQEKQSNGTNKDPPPPAPIPTNGGNKLPPPTLQITLHDENNQQQSLMGRTDLSPVSEEDLKSIAETVASEETVSGITITSSSQKRPINHLPNSSGSASTSSSIQPSAAFRSDLKEAGCDSLLIALKKDEGQQWGMGIGKRPRGILITSLQPGSSAAEKLAIGDRIMAVNAHEVTTQHSAVTYIRSSGNSVTLQISRPAKLSTTTSNN